MKRPWRRRRAVLSLLWKSSRERRVLPGEQAPGRAEHPGEGECAQLNRPRPVCGMPTAGARVSLVETSPGLRRGVGVSRHVSRCLSGGRWFE